MALAVFVQDGESIDYTPSSAVAAGDGALTTWRMPRASSK